MADMVTPRHPMPTQDPQVRRRNFDEVALGYTEQQAREEAARCLACRNKPCCEGCPVHIDIPAFLAAARDGEFERAYDILAASSSLPAVCGRVCPQETQCEARCVRGIKGEPVAIGRLERFVADRHLAQAGLFPTPPAPTGRRVAVIGSGPSGLTCAGELARMGHAVTVFEALHRAGGVLVYGIPEFRLPKRIVQQEIDNLLRLGVEIRTDMVIGRVLTVDELFAQGYHAVFIGSGAGLPHFMKIPGEQLCGVCSANEFLTRVNLMKAYLPGSDTPLPPVRRTVVVGGGNVAMDAARCAMRLGAEQVTVVYRRSEAEMPARREEIEHAKEEGIAFATLTNPVEILGQEGKAAAVRCIRTELGQPDASGRRRPVEIPGSEFEIAADCVIMALGTSPNPLITSTTPGLATDRHGCLTVGEAGETSRPGVFAGGDAVTGAATVILAMGAGKEAARAIDAYMKTL